MDSSVSMEGEHSCSCDQTASADCTFCGEIRLRHHIVCNRGDNQSAEIGSLVQFTTGEECQICFVVTRAFLRSLEARRDDELIRRIHHGYIYHGARARFSFPRELNSTSKTGDSESLEWMKGKCLRATFHQDVDGPGRDGGGTASIGAAFFQVGSSQLPRNEQYHAGKDFSSSRPKIGHSVDWELINKWLQACRESHTDQCQSNSSEPLNMPARLIDVHDYCVVETPSSCEYLTLSYIWGQKNLSKPMQTATRSSIASLQEPGALSRIDLPNTILDAIYACMRIGHRYLWIDSLCIVQDDEDDVKEQIARMSDIYSGAFLAMIAAWGDNADSGLPGVIHGPPRASQHIARFDGLEVIEVFPLFGEVLKHSAWRTRAWTQQEWLLSERRLYFTNVQVYFECKTALHNEDSWVMKLKDSNKTPEKSGSDGRVKFREPETTQLWPRFRTLLEDYTRRELSFNSDIFNACAGIYDFIYGRTAKRFIFGLPESNFVEALRWHSRQCTIRVAEL